MPDLTGEERCPECDDLLDDHRRPADVLVDDPYEAARCEERGEDPITCIDCADCTYDVGERLPVHYVTKARE